ncbi:unnamed protein product, partial [Pleuronectes platessa]
AFNSDAACKQLLDILRGLARLRTSVSTYFIGFVFEHEAPGSGLSHHLIIRLPFEQDGGATGWREDRGGKPAIGSFFLGRTLEAHRLERSAGHTVHVRWRQTSPLPGRRVTPVSACGSFSARPPSPAAPPLRSHLVSPAFSDSSADLQPPALQGLLTHRLTTPHTAAAGISANTPRAPRFHAQPAEARGGSGHPGGCARTRT